MVASKRCALVQLSKWFKSSKFSSDSVCKFTVLGVFFSWAESAQALHHLQVGGPSFGHSSCGIWRNSGPLNQKTVWIKIRFTCLFCGEVSRVLMRSDVSERIYVLGIATSLSSGSSESQKNLCASWSALRISTWWNISLMSPIRPNFPDLKFESITKVVLFKEGPEFRLSFSLTPSTFAAASLTARNYFLASFQTSNTGWKLVFSVRIAASVGCAISLPEQANFPSVSYTSCGLLKSL